MAWRLGLVGHNIGHSLSPRIFEWFFRASNLNGTYRLWDVPPSALKSVLAENAWDGLNVTIPFKTDVLAFCENVGDAARSAGAVNTLRRLEIHLRGENTDSEGFLIALRKLAGKQTKFERGLIIGSGGAARACALVLTNEEIAGELTLASRQPERASVALSEALQGVKMCNVEDATKELREFDLIVQATPIGSVNMPGVPLPKPLAFRKQAAVMDLIYAPRETEFLRLAKQSGAHVMNGLPMLIAQAAASFKLWTDVEIPTEKAITELLPTLEAA